MATMTKEEVEEYNRQVLEEVKDSGPGTYRIDYKYYDETQNSVYTIQYRLRVGNIDSNACINYNGVGGGGVETFYSSYLDNNEHNSIDIDIAFGRDHVRGTTPNAYFYNGTASLMEDISDTFEIGTNIMYDGHSFSADFVNHIGAKHAGNYDVDNLYIFLSEPDANQTLNASEIEALKDSNATIIHAFSQQYLYNKRLRAADHYEGVHSLDIKINAYDSNGRNYESHNLPVDLFAQCGISNLANGEFDFNNLPDTFYYSIDNKNLTLSYDFVEWYYDEEGKFVKREYHVDPSDRSALELLNLAICTVVSSSIRYLRNCISTIIGIINSSKTDLVSISFDRIKAEVLLHALEEKGVYVSSGSACSSNHPGISSTLQAIGVKKELLDSTLRFSFSRYTIIDEIDYCIDVLKELVPFYSRFTRK